MYSTKYQALKLKVHFSARSQETHMEVWLNRPKKAHTKQDLTGVYKNFKTLPGEFV